MSGLWKVSIGSVSGGVVVMLTSGYVLCSLLTVGQIGIASAENIDGKAINLLTYTQILLYISGGVILLLMLLVLECIRLLTQLIVSYLVCQWYFTRPKSSLNVQVMNKSWLMIRYHLGSISLLAIQNTLKGPLGYFIEITNTVLRRPS